MSDDLKIVTRGARYPRKYKKIRSVSLCDQDGQVVATIDFSLRGIHIDALEGFPVSSKIMNGLGQYTLEGEPEASFNCPHCVEDDVDSYGRARKDYAHAKKWADGSVRKDNQGLLKPVYRVVCKRCGGGRF
jgi:hypothetical protein